MTSEQWKKVKSLFEQIITLDPSEEKTYLETNCEDELVRKEVESLLKSHKQSADFLLEVEHKLHFTKSEKDIAQDSNNPKNSSNLANSKPNNNLGTIESEFIGTSRFLIQRRLGAGGFGVVYQAYDRERNSIVALKTLYQADAEDLYRFKKEFRGLADIVHPNLAAMYELFSEQQQWFFTMEMIYGKNFLEYVNTPKSNTKSISSSDMQTASVVGLRSDDNITQDELLGQTSNTNPYIISNSSLNTAKSVCQADLPKLRSALKQLAEGLYALHQAGKLHRDLKPSNVLVTKEGRVVILDFGLISDLTAQGVNQISTDNIVGTPAYMSPEHSAGIAISPASDWYSVGTMLYLSLTGKLPFDGSPMEILLSKQRNEAQPPSKLVTGIPEDLDKLCQNLLKRNPRLRPKAEDILALLGSSEDNLPKATSSLTKPAALFIGREKELAELSKAWQLTKQGYGVTVYIKGRSGMGKSTTINHFLESLKQNEKDLLVFSGRCYEQESVPYKAIDNIIDLLSKYLKSLSTLEVEALLPLDIMALARLFPVLRQVEAVANSRRNILDSPDSQDLRRKAFNALRELLIRLSNKKDVIVSIDDLQWGDLDSVGLLLEIMRPPDTPRLLFIGSYRSEEADTSLFLKSLFSLQPTNNEKAIIQEITIEELSTAESQKLVTALLGQEKALKRAEVIVKESGGSPFFISELAQYALTKVKKAETDPDSIEMTVDNVINARIAQLPEEGLRLLEIVAVSGQPLARVIAKKAAAITLDEHILPILRTNHLVRLTGTSTYEEIDTYHDRIRETILANLSSEALKNYHYSLALALEATSSVDPERLAKHFQLAGERDKASDYTISAAQQADEALAFDRAAYLYRQSLELKQTPDPTTTSLKIKLGNALSNAGKGAEAAKVYLAATANSNRQGLLSLQHKAAEQFLNAGHIDEGLDLLNVVLKKVGMQLTENMTRLFLSIIVGRIKLWLRGMSYKERNEAEIPSEQLTQIDVCWTAVDSLAPVDIIQAANFQNKHIILALNAGEPCRLVRAVAFECVFSSRRGSKSKTSTAKLNEMLLNLAQRTNKPELLAMVNFIKAQTQYMEGNWQTAWDLFCVGEKITYEQCLGENYVFALRGMDNSITFALRVAYHLGNIMEILARLPGLLKNAQDRSNLFLLTNLNTIILYIKYLVGDEPEKAYQELSQTSNLWTNRGFHIQHYWRILAYGDIGLYLGKGEATWAKLQQQWPALKKSLILKSQNSLIEALHLQARVALATAKEVSNSGRYLSIAEKNAKRILREKTLYGDAWAELILASVAATRKKDTVAITYLTSAEKKFENANMALYAAVTRRRRGELLGGEVGSKLITDSDNWMSNQQIKNPSHIADMLAPGEWCK